MKKYLSFLSIILVIVALFSLTACNNIIYTYYVDGEEVYITGINKNFKGTEFNVPEKIENLPVTKIYNCAFQKSNISSIILPNTITEICEYAFYNCTNLKGIVFPNSLEKIGTDAFYGCTSLKEINFGSKLVSLSSSAFYNCANLEKITISSENETYKSIDGVVYSKYCLEIYPMAKQDKEFLMPDFVQEISEYAFANNVYLEKISFSAESALINIDDNAFLGCSGLKSFEVPLNVEFIGKGAFKMCSNMTSFTLNSKVESISYALLRGCTKLEEINIPDTITDIGGYAFHDTKWLEDKRSVSPYVVFNGVLIDASNVKGDAIIPEDVFEVGEYAFCNNENITSITLNEELLYIEMCAFKGCKNLSDINFYETKLDYIGYKAFEDCTGLRSIVIPRSVTTIASRAFANCTGALLITIPSGVTSILSGAFTGLSSNVIVYCEADEAGSEWSNSMFDTGITLTFGKDLNY